MVQVIGMGLPKTGTTSLSYELRGIGLHVAHNLGDRLSDKCDAICNTLEDKYVELYQKHPNATWIITHSKNVSAWIESVEEHRKHFFPNSSYYEPRYYGGVGVRLATGFVQELEYRYRKYYDGLFKFLNSQNITYGYIDYRRGIRRGLDSINKNLTRPLHMNDKNHRQNGVHDYRWCRTVGGD